MEKETEGACPSELTALHLPKEAGEAKAGLWNRPTALVSYMLMHYLYPRKHFQEIATCWLSPMGPQLGVSLFSDGWLVDAEPRQKFGGAGRRNKGGKLWTC